VVVVVVSEDMDGSERKFLFLVRAKSEIVKLGVVRPPNASWKQSSCGE
jgi:hypothetical protein